MDKKACTETAVYKTVLEKNIFVVVLHEDVISLLSMTGKF